MAKAFSVASWNVEHFKSQGVSSRVEDVVEFLAGQRPDVFALYEVEGREVFDALTKLMPEYTFHITEGQQVQQMKPDIQRVLGAVPCDPAAALAAEAPAAAEGPEG